MSDSLQILSQVTLRFIERTSYVSIWKLLLFLPITAVTASIPEYALNVAEVNLLSDSSNADYWAEYGWALWELGDLKADWAFNRALHENPECSEARRGLAAMVSVHGDYDAALMNSSYCESSNTLCLIMRLSNLQQIGNLIESDELLESVDYQESSTYYHLFQLLKIRQSRLIGDRHQATLLLASALKCPESCLHQQIFRFEQYLLGDTETVMNPEDILAVLRFDQIYLGAVYRDDIQMLIDSTEMSDPILPARVQQMTGNCQSAFELLPERLPLTVPLQDKIWVTNLLLRLDKYDAAMELVDSIIMMDSTATDAWILKGVLLLKNHQHYKAFDTMQEAADATGGEFKCLAMAGLAAELAGESKLSVERYAPLLEISSDSVVFINRMRELVLDEDLNYNFDYQEIDCFSSTERSWLNGGFSISYSGTIGEVEQSQLGISANASHTYGLYCSAISAFMSYSLQKWPGSSGLQEVSSTSISTHYYNSSRYNGTLEVTWEQLRYDVNRWKIEISASVGSRYQPITPLVFSINAGIGRTLNKWDTKIGYEANWMALTSLSCKLNGQMFSNYLPVLTVSADFDQQFDNLSRYDIYGNVQLVYYTPGFLSFSVGYNLEYLSAIPPEYDDIFNASTFTQMGFHF